jgi:hypothetical protein
MSATPKESEKAEPPEEKKRTFASAAGDKVRAEHRRVGLIGTLVAGALGGGAYGVHRSAEKFLPTETRKALEETENVFNRMRMSRALSGHKADNDDVIENYATQASRLANAEVAGMQGRELVKLLRSKLPVQNKWHPFFSDAHYDAFARGPAYGAAQLIDEHAVAVANRSNISKKLKQYLVDKWPEKFSDKVNATALSIAGQKMDVGPSLRESLAYGGDTIAADKQPAITKQIIRGSLFNKDRIPVFGGFSDHYKDLKKDLANGLMESSFPNYIGLGHKAKGVHSALKYTLPALLGAAGVGVGGYGLLKLIKSIKRTPYEKRMMAKAEREGEKSDNNDEPEKSAMIKQEGDEWVLYTSDGDRVLGRHSTAKEAYAQEYAIKKSQEKSASILNSIRNLINLQPKVRSIASLTKVPEEFEQLNTNIHGLLNDAGISSPEFTPDVNETISYLVDKLGLNNHPAGPKSTAQPMSKNASTMSRLRKARNITHTHPTPSQAHAGNYRKGAFKFQGMKIKIENPNDTTRRGYNKDGEEIWSRVMKADYGYFVGTKAVDGDAVDCFIGSNLDSELVVAVDQYKGDKFDETKFILGCDSQAEGEKLYMAHYPKGWTLGPVSTCTTQQLKTWLKEGNTKKPFKGQMVKSASDDEPSTIGKGLGTLFSDFVPYAPSGARRSGAASLMAERIGTDPGLLLKYPMLSQVAAMLGGGVLAKPVYDATGSVGGAAATSLLPYMLVQALKRSRIQEIDRDYKTKPRKRLREVGSDEMVDDAMGSHRLGMAQANDAMRNRKYRDIGAIAEAADTLPVATSLMGLGPAASLPLTQLIDQLESRKFINKKADFSDQISGPAIPMYLAAAGLGTAGLMAAGKKLRNDLNDPNLKNMPRGEWDGLSKHISKRDLLSAEVPGLNNAFFARAKNDAEAQGLLRYIALHDPVVRKKLSLLDPFAKKLRKQVQEHGLIAFDPTFGKASIVGHEAGHGKIEHTPGLMQSLQRHLYRYSPVIAPLSAVGGMAAGLATKNTLGGLLAGTGIGLLGGAGMMFPEYMATHHGMQGLKTYKGGKFAQPGDWGRQLTALGTYGALNVLPAALSGAFGGYIGGRRKKRREQAEANIQEPDNVIRMDEDSRKVEKAANLVQRFQQIQKLKIQAKALGSDYADKSALKQLGGYLKPSINQFFNSKEVQQLGIKKGMKPAKILDILRKVSGSQS